METETPESPAKFESPAKHAKQVAEEAVAEAELVKASIQIDQNSRFSQMASDFAHLERVRRELEEALLSVKVATKEIGEYLLEEMQLTGLERISIGNLTIKPKHTHYVSRKGEYTNEQLCEKLKELGFEYLVGENYQPSGLKSKIIEMQNNGDPIPAELAQMLSIGTVTELTTYKG